MTNITNTNIMAKIPQRSGRMQVTFIFTVQDDPEKVIIGPSWFPEDTNLNTIATSIAATIDTRLVEREWSVALTEATDKGLNPLRAARVYRYQTKAQIAQRMKNKVDERVVMAKSRLTKAQNLKNNIYTFLGLI